MASRRILLQSSIRLRKLLGVTSTNVSIPKVLLELLSRSPLITACAPVFQPFLFMHFRTLSFSVSRKSCICHSYENNRGVYQKFPFWNSTPFAHHYHPRCFFSYTYKLPIFYPLCFDIHASDGGCRGTRR